MNLSKRSAHDGMYLPTAYARQHSDSTLLAYLHSTIAFAPEWWNSMSLRDKVRVLRHLITERKIKANEPRVSQLLGQWPSSNLVGPDGRTYPPKSEKEGARRMLPSWYTTLKDMWVRSDGTPMDPFDMNESHVKNTMELLKESHCANLGGAGMALDTISRHFRNRPDIVEACHQMQELLDTVDVEQMYPIWAVLAEARSSIELRVELRRLAEEDGFRRYGY